MRAALLTSLVAVILCCNSCQLRGQDEIFLLPNQFSGAVFILYDQQAGKSVTVENGNRVYQIPQNGILVTQAKFNKGWRYPGQYFYTVGDKRIEIPYVIESRDVKNGVIQVCCMSSGKSAKNANGPSVEYLQFYVGTKDQIDEASSKRDKVNPADFIGL